MGFNGNKYKLIATVLVLKIQNLSREVFRRSQALDQWQTFSISYFQTILVQRGYQHKPAYINPNAGHEGFIRALLEDQYFLCLKGHSTLNI